jgi:uncharacterized protein YndB with AHSA1/START domain
LCSSASGWHWRMNTSATAIRMPDLSARPFNLVAEHTFAVQAAALYQAWTVGFDQWFAAPGSVIMSPEVNTVFFFETEFKHASETVVSRHPHYGRFLRLIPHSLVELTWVTGALGTEGSETVVTVKLASAKGGTHLHLTHAGFPNAAACDRHSQAWPGVLTHLEERIAKTNTR